MDQHDWHSEAYVAEWVRRQRLEDAARESCFRLMADIIPFLKDAAISILDIGAGYGPVSAAMLENFPNAQITLMDYSQPMLGWARNFLAPHSSRVSFIEADLSQTNALGKTNGGFNVAVSALTFHNLQNASRIRESYGEVFRALRPGGCFLNLDLISAPTPALQRLYGRAILSRRESASRHLTASENDRSKPDRQGSADGTTHELARGSNRHERFPPFPGGLDDQLAWFRDAGFSPVDCFWKELGVALVGGFR